MEFTIERDPFLGVLKHASRTATRTAGHVERGCVCLRACGGSLRVDATDLTVSLSTTLACDTPAPGARLTEAKPLFDAVRALPEAPVKVHLAEQLHVRAGSASFRLPSLPAERFPKMPAPGQATFQSVSVEHLAALVDQTLHAISPDDTRPHLHGLLLETEDDVLRAVALDGHRLVRAECSAEGVRFERPILVPRKAVVELRSLLQEGDCEVALGKTHLFARVGPTRLTAQLITAEFPPYRDVFPTAPGDDAEVPRAPLAAAVRRSLLVASRVRQTVVCEFSAGQLELSSDDPVHGAVEETLPIGYEGPTRRLGCNGRYLADFLDASNGEQVRFAIRGELDPLAITPELSGAVTSEGILMPMRLSAD